MAITNIEREELSKKVEGYLEALYQKSKIKLEDINLPTRIKLALQRRGCKNLGELIGKSTRWLSDLRNVGSETLQEALKVFSEQGLVVSGDTISFGESPMLDAFVKRGGVLATLDELDSKFFVKDSATMDAIARDVAKYYDMVVIPKLDAAKNNEELEQAKAAAEEIQRRYYSVIDEKRAENAFEAKKAKTAGIIGGIRSEIVRHHHEEYENPIFGREEGHKHNPFGGRVK